MPKASPLIESFNAGELSPLLIARESLKQYKNGVKYSRNMVHSLQGPSRKRNGTRFVAATKTAGNRSWMVPFEFNVTQSYALEFGDRYIRFYTNHAQLQTGAVGGWLNNANYKTADLVAQGGVNYYCIVANTNVSPPNAAFWYPLTGTIYEIPSPYLLADLTAADGTFNLQVTPSNDVIYITSATRTYAPRKLSRLAAGSFRLDIPTFKGGPFNKVNPDKANGIVTASAAEGNITITAFTVGFFVATDVGSLFYMEQDNLALSVLKQWEPGKVVVAGDQRRVDIRNYSAVTGGTTGTKTPVHTSGIQYDGDAGVQWRFDNPSYGWALITGFTDSQHVTATVISKLPAAVVSGTGSWIEQPDPKNFNINDIAWNGSLFVAVGNADGGDAYIITSPDGSVWTERANPKNFTLNGVAYANGLFVAVGNSDGGDAYIVSSPDGITWTEQANPVAALLRDLAYSPQLGLWCAVGDITGGTVSYIITSPDAVTWTQQLTGVNASNLNDIAWSPQLGLFCAIGGMGGAVGNIATTSPDGITWTLRNQGSASATLFGIVWAAELSLFVACGDNTVAAIATSPDGVNWTRRPIPVNKNLRGSVMWNGSVLIATGTTAPAGGIGALLSSSNGINWTALTHPKNVNLNSSAWNGTNIVAVGDADGVDGYIIIDPGKTAKWAFGAWSDTRGWPTNCTFFRDRLTFGRDLSFWCSVEGDYEDMAGKDDGGIVVADQAISGTIQSDQSNLIRWMVPSDTALLVGTGGEEHAISEITPSEPFGPGNVQSRKQSAFGSRRVTPARIGDNVFFIQRSGRKLMMERFNSDTGRYQGVDRTPASEHITKSGIIDMAYQQEPLSVLWQVRADGQLVGFTTNEDQEVSGFHRHRIGGASDAASGFAAVESVLVINSPDGKRHELWMQVRRLINGTVARYIEWIDASREDGDNPEDVFYVDAGLTFDGSRPQTLIPGVGATVAGSVGVGFSSGFAGAFSAGDVGRYIHYSFIATSVDDSISYNKAVAKITGFIDDQHVTCEIEAPWPSLTAIGSNLWRVTVTTITGLGHLEGQAVDICADGAAHARKTVTAATINLDTPSSKAHIGLSCSSVVVPMPLAAGAADGTAQGKTGRASRLIMRFFESVGAKYGRAETGVMKPIKEMSSQALMDSAMPLFTGDVLVDFPDGYTAQQLLAVLQDNPLPCTLVALMPQTTVQDSR